MLADINLLPTKPTKNMANYITLLITAIIIIIGLAYFYRQGAMLQEETADLVFQTEAVAMEIQYLEEELAMLEIASVDFRMQANIIEALSQTINTTEIMNEIINHVSPEATVLNYAYATGTHLSLSILVDESRDAGSFAESLTTIPWVLQAKVESVALISESNQYQTNIAITLDRTALTSWQWEGAHE